LTHYLTAKDYVKKHFSVTALFSLVARSIAPELEISPRISNNAKSFLQKNHNPLRFDQRVSVNFNVLNEGKGFKDKRIKSLQ